MSNRAFVIFVIVVVAVLIVAVYMHMPLVRHSLGMHGGPAVR